MRLKILIVPFSLIMILILSIGYIKPDFDTILAKKAEIIAQDELQVQADTVLQNISSLNSSLDKDLESEKFILNYLPFALNQEQTIDAFNYLASQFGLIVTDMDMKKSQEQPTTTLAPDGTIVEVAPTVETYVFTGGVFGSYENIKAFFNRLSHIGRYQDIQLFTIEKDPQTDANAGSTDLKGVFVAEYGYLAKHPGISALASPIFLQSEIDFADAKALLLKTTSLPLLEKGTPGRPNPFQ